MRIFHRLRLYRILWIIVLVTTELSLIPLHAEAQDNTQKQSVQRLALFVSANNGGADRETLLYADSDAQALERVLRELGGLDSAQVLRLHNARPQRLRQALQQVQQRLQRLREQGLRSEFLFYYSGHSDARGLLLGDGLFSYRELRSSLDKLPAEMRIAVVDACASGNLTRLKGGRRLEPFVVPQNSKIKGLAILTSSSASESSQESDLLAASFFTHYLVSALRGAADSNDDGQVTINEAYQFAFQRTLARTQKSAGGAQHPSYDMQLSGSGDLVLTQIRARNALLVLQPDLQGQVSVIDAKGQVQAELFKTKGRRQRLALSPGAYQLFVRESKQSYGASLHLQDARAQKISYAQLKKVQREQTRARGARERPYLVIPFELSLYPQVTSNGFFGGRVMNYFSLSLLAGRAAKLHGFGLGLLASWVDEEVLGLQLSTGANIVPGKLLGAQLSLGANLLGQNGDGIQASLFANLGGDHLRGGQMALGSNLLRGDLCGVQLLSLFNAVGGDLNGVQVSSAYNVVVGSVRGLQLAGGGNLAQGTVYGTQLALGVNLAPRHYGLQFGLVNISGQSTGAQIGLVNIADEVNGTQIGMVNISKKHSGAPVGLVNVVGDGMLHGLVAYEDSSLFNLALRYGSRQVYTQLTAGLSPEAEYLRWLIGAGLALRLWPQKSLYCDLGFDLFTQHRGRWAFDHLDLMPRLRVALGYQMLSHLGIEAGLSLNSLFAQGTDLDALSPLPAWDLSRADMQILLWPGAQLALQF